MKTWIKNAFVKAMKTALRDPEIQMSLWHAVNRPNVQAMDGIKPRDPWLQAWDAACEDAADYISQHMLTTPIHNNRESLFDAALARSEVAGSYLDFGCGFEMNSIKYLAARIEGIIHGFDSFEGLPEAWFGNLGKGSLASDGIPTQVPENVKLHPGWFDTSVPVFAAEHPEPVAFMHIDCDLYSSTRTVFEALGEQIGPGTVIQFDEYFNYPGWRGHEFKAFQEFIKDRDLSYEYLGYTRKFSVAVRLT